jgi:hypothetical protein
MMTSIVSLLENAAFFLILFNNGRHFKRICVSAEDQLQLVLHFVCPRETA